MNELQLINAYFITILAITGACAGSFINVAALRRSEGLSFISGRSHCPSCNKKLQWFELVPVLSWLAQFGRCRTCKTRIPPRYMLVEIIGGAAAAMSFVRYRLTWMTPLVFCVAIILLAITMIDLTSREIPDGLIIALIPFAIGAIWAQPEVTPLSRAIGIIAVSLPMLVLAFFIDGAFGGGDIKLMAVCGAMLGWQSTLPAFFIGVVFAGCVSVTLMIRKKAGRGAHIAFGPHLCLGVMAALLYGREIISWYLKLYGL